jgi:signal-transduction protein with cAMP-binding, CBS, and nucleotidyltransferase domain
MRKVLFILSELLDEDVEWLATEGERVSFAAGAELIALASRVESVFIVLDGTVDVLAPNGAVIVQLGSGEILGEMSLVDPARTTAAVRAHDDTVVLRLRNDMLRVKLTADQGFAARFYRALAVFLADRMRNTTRRLGQGAAGADPKKAQLDDINEELLDKVYLAGARFDRLLKRLAN